MGFTTKWYILSYLMQWVHCVHAKVWSSQITFFTPAKRRKSIWHILIDTLLSEYLHNINKTKCCTQPVQRIFYSLAQAVSLLSCHCHDILIILTVIMTYKEEDVKHQAFSTSPPDEGQRSVSHSRHFTWMTPQTECWGQSEQSNLSHPTQVNQSPHSVLKFYILFLL